LILLCHRANSPGLRTDVFCPCHVLIFRPFRPEYTKVLCHISYFDHTSLNFSEYSDQVSMLPKAGFLTLGRTSLKEGRNHTKGGVLWEGNTPKNTSLPGRPTSVQYHERDSCRYSEWSPMVVQKDYDSGGC